MSYTYQLKNEIAILRGKIWDMDNPKKRSQYNHWIRSHVGKAVPDLTVAELKILKLLLQDKIQGKHCRICASQVSKAKRRRQKGVATSAWKSLRDRIIRQRGRICEDCGKVDLEKYDLTLDHVIPLFKGGLTAIENLRILCVACHNFKSNGAEGKEAKRIFEETTKPQLIKKVLSIKV